MFHMKHRFVWFCSKHVSDEAPSRLVLYKTYVTCGIVSPGCDSAMFHMKHNPGWFCSRLISDEASSCLFLWETDFKWSNVCLVLYKAYVTCSAISSGCDSAMFHMKHLPESEDHQAGRHLAKDRLLKKKVKESGRTLKPLKCRGDSEQNSYV